MRIKPPKYHWEKLMNNKSNIMDFVLKENRNPQYNIDEDDSEDEGIEDYKIGGYHPVHVGYYS